MNPTTRAALAGIEAFGEIMGTPGPQLAAILDRAREKLGVRDHGPPPDLPTPPPPPP